MSFAPAIPLLSVSIMSGYFGELPLLMDIRLYMGVHGCDIQNSEELETTQTAVH